MQSHSISSQYADYRSEPGWHPLKVYCYYRLLVSIILLSVFFWGFEETTVGHYNRNLFLFTSILYAILNVGSLLAVNLSRYQTQSLAFIIVFLDIVFITMLAHSSGGIMSNLSILMVVAVAAGSILIVGQTATLMAAIATIAVIYEQFHFSFVLKGQVDSNQFMQAGLLGVAFFGTSLLSQQLSIRLRESEMIASQSASELADLQELHHHIIQRMRTGIVVVDDKRRIRMMNESAWKMFGMPTRSKAQSVNKVSPELNQHLRNWQRNSQSQAKPFRASLGGPEIAPNFTRLTAGQSEDILVFLDDTSRMAQQAQQLKLASLGRLTAGIAHEIRNPLGAISHAAQLLGEAEQLNQADSRLVEIIQQHSIRMNTIIENVLQLSRRKQAKPELIRLQDWLTKFIQDYTLYCADDPEILVSYTQAELLVCIDTTQLSQVLTNLFDNGIRYSKEVTGKPFLSVTGGVGDASKLPFLEIVDKGPGVDPEELNSIFEPFYTTSVTGTGLGLYISRELCQANQAILDYSPIATGGGCFRITFAHPEKSIN